MRDEVYVGALFSEDYLAHYGVGHLQGGHSGRYPWGSGKRPKQSGLLKETITAERVKKYSSQAKQLNHVRINKNTSGYIYTKNGKVQGMINTEKKEDGNVWIQGLELFGESKGIGLSKDILDVAVKELGATRLSVNKSNGVAKHVYDKYGFKVYDEDDSMYYMALNKNRSVNRK